MSKIIAVDVDLTVVDTFTPWMTWFEEQSGGIPVKNESGAYDLVPEMKEILKSIGKEDVNPFSFWQQEGLYDDLTPLSWSQIALWSLKNLGHKVLFVSSCVPEHTASKIRFLDKWFPWRSGFIATHEKEFVGYDVLIDDKLAHLRLGHRQRPNSKHILFTGVRPDGKPEHRSKFEELRSWADIHYAKLGF